MDDTDDVRDVKKVTDYDQNFLTFVETEIRRYIEEDKLGKETNLSFDSLYYTLQKYQHTYWSILAMYEKANNDYKQKHSQFQVWWDKKFILIRARENRVDLTAQKWASKAELESMTRVENEVEYLKWEEELRYYEGIVSFTKRILDQWMAQSHILGHLTNLLKTDVGTTNIGNKIG